MQLRLNPLKFGGRIQAALPKAGAYTKVLIP